MKNILKTIIILILLSSCSPREEEFIEEWGIYHYFNNDVDMFQKDKENITQIATPLYFNYKKGRFKFKTDTVVEGRFDLMQSDTSSSYIRFKDCNKSEIEGIHLFRIDTIKKNKMNLELRLLITSDSIYIEGRKSVFTGL